jgi:hypothetical protein
LVFFVVVVVVLYLVLLATITIHVLFGDIFLTAATVVNEKRVRRIRMDIEEKKVPK